jgi:phosphotransferase system HPr-like phosphotransfer protein
MNRRRWKNIQPTSLRHGLELCKDFAKEARNMSVERIAVEMGVTDQWTVYKWLQTGRMPANMIRPYERACGCDYVTRWIAASAGRLTIVIPTGRNCTAKDMQALQELLTTAAGRLLAFYAENIDADDALAAIQAAMEGLAWHRGNVAQTQNPQLELEGQS